jgi:hypothetical protein
VFARSPRSCAFRIPVILHVHTTVSTFISRQTIKAKKGEKSDKSQEFKKTTSLEMHSDQPTFDFQFPLHQISIHTAPAKFSLPKQPDIKRGTMYEN